MKISPLAASFLAITGATIDSPIPDKVKKKPQSEQEKESRLAFAEEKRLRKQQRNKHVIN
jgi:hypothetical protein